MWRAWDPEEESVIKARCHIQDGTRSGGNEKKEDGLGRIVFSFTLT